MHFQKAKTLEETLLLSKKNTLEGVKNAQLYLEHSHQLFYKCVKYTFWPLLHILNQKTLHISPFKSV